MLKMQVNDSLNNKSNDFYSNTCGTLTPVTFLLKVFGLDYNAQRKSDSCRLFFMGALFGSLSAFVLYFKIYHLSGTLTVSVRITDHIQTVYDYCQYAVDLYYVHQFGRRYHHDYLTVYRAIDQVIGTGSCMMIKKKLVKLVTFMITMWLVTSALDYAAWVIAYGWITPSVFSLAYLYFLIKILNNLDLTSQTMHIEVRLRAIGNLMYTYYTSTPTQPGVTCESLQSWNWFHKTARLSLREREALKYYATMNCHEIRWLTRCYLMLVEQCDFINKMFGIRILLNCSSLLIDMVRFTNLAVRIVTGSQHTTYESPYYYYFPVVSTSTRLLMCMLILLCLVRHCQKAYQQTDKIVKITEHILLYKKPDPAMQEAVKELRDLVQQRPISFHLANFFRLDNPMLLSTASVVVTYTIILLQSMN